MQRLDGLLQAIPVSRLCVALSGGPDSVALLAALAMARHGRASSARLPLRALHVNHGLQPQADRWARECRKLGRALGVPVSVREVVVTAGRGRSLEAAAREARRGAFVAALRPGEALLTAHHLDDQLETVLLMLLRGSGVHGLAAMPPVQPFGKGWLLRPLLEEPRSALAAFVARRDLASVIDASNADERFDRNYLRHKVTPLLETRWPGASRAVARSARLLGEARGLLDELAQADLAQIDPAQIDLAQIDLARPEEASARRSLGLPGLASLTVARQRNALRAWLRGLGALLPDEVHLERIRVELPAARRDAQPFVRWQGGEVRRFRARLYFFPPMAASGADSRRVLPGEWLWSRGRPFELGPGRGALRLLVDPQGSIARDTLPPRLWVRARVPGATVTLHPGGPTHAVKELLRVRGILPWERDRLPVVCDGAQIVSVGGLFVTAPYQATGPGRGGRLRLEWVDPPEFRVEENAAIC
jgi:tRNA(Ile)-lysidine synthase